jgi:voltage-dependent potassium channel beta subunit
MLALAYGNGVNFFDNAEAYAQGQSETLMGEALHELAWSRDSYCVSSKVFWGGDKPTQRGLHRKHVFDACHAALKRLQVDYLDLYFCHRPDMDTPIEETVRAMHDLVAQGKVLYWGTSEWSARELTEAYAVAERHHLTPPTMEQPQYNMFERQKMERNYLPLFEGYGLGTTIWSPLASGILTGKYAGGIPEDSRLGMKNFQWLRARYETDAGRMMIEKTERLQALSNEAGLAIHHLALLWCLENPHVSSIILGASSTEQLVDNLNALELRDKLTPELLKQVEAILDNRPESRERF